MKKNKLSLLAALLAGTMLTCTGCGEQKIDLNDYVAVEFSGYDGFGDAQGSIDADKLKEVVTDKNAAAAIEAAAIGYFDSVGELSNGDDAAYTWRVSEDKIKSIEKKYGLKLQYKDFTTEVEGLKDPSEYDPSELLDLSLTGPSGRAILTVESNNRAFIVEADERAGLSNGDVVNITFTATDSGKAFDATCADNNIPVFDPNYQYTVSGLPELITDISQVPEGIKPAIKERVDEFVQDKLEHYKEPIKMNGSGNGGQQITSMEYIGAAFITRHDGGNELILVYKTQYVKPSTITLYSCYAVKDIDDRPEMPEDGSYDFDFADHFGCTSYDGYIYNDFESVDAIMHSVQSLYDLAEQPTLQEFPLE